MVQALNYLLVRSEVPIGNFNQKSKRVLDFSNWLEPLVAEAESLDPRVSLIPLEERLNDPVFEMLESNAGMALEAALKAIGDHEVDTVIFVPSLGIGGAEKVALNLAEGLWSQGRKILFIETSGSSGKSFTELKKGLYRFSPESAFLSLDLNSTTRFYYCLIQSLDVNVVININSAPAYRLFEKHLELLKLFCKTYIALFCGDFDEFGHDRGYATQYFTVLAGRLDGIISDNSVYVSQLEDMYSVAIEPTKLHVLYQPISATNPPQIPINRKIENILWAGRPVLQKGPETLVNIAALLPEIQFHVYGASAEDFAKLTKHSPKNIKFYGTYKSIFETIGCEPDLFLHTSKWDGIPNVLLEVGAMGLPIISSGCGAIPELLGKNSERGRLVWDYQRAEAFVEAIQSLSANPHTRATAANAMLEYLNKRHSWETFNSELERQFQEINQGPK